MASPEFFSVTPRAGPMEEAGKSFPPSERLAPFFQPEKLCLKKLYVILAWAKLAYVTGFSNPFPPAPDGRTSGLLQKRFSALRP